MSPRMLASAMYFLFFGAGGALSPFLVLYYQDVGMTKQQIGVLIAVTTLTMVIASAAWSALADAFRLHRYLLPAAILGTILPVGLLMVSNQFWALLALVMIYALFSGPIVPLTDNAVLEILGDDRESYGRLRVWGAVGFGLSAWIGGLLAEQFGLTIIFVIFMTLMFLCGLLATRLPAPPAKANEPFLKNLRLLATNRVWLLFLIVLFLVGMGSSFIHNYSALYLTDLGAGEGLFGLTVLVAGIAELPVFFYSARLLKRFSASGLLMISFGALVIRLLIFSAIPSPEWALLPQLLHGLTFSAFWAAAVVYMADLAPPGLGATAQSSLGLVFFSAAGAVGGIIGANIYDSLGPQMLYRFGAILVATGLVGFLLIELVMRPLLVAAKARVR